MLDERLTEVLEIVVDDNAKLTPLPEALIVFSAACKAADESFGRVSR